jgi:hypothetical protein
MRADRVGTTKGKGRLDMILTSIAALVLMCLLVGSVWFFVKQGRR